MTGAVEAAEAGASRLTPATVAAKRRAAPPTRAAMPPVSVGSMATRRTPVSAAGPPRAPVAAATCTKRAGPVQTASVKAVAAAPSPPSSSGASSHGPQAEPSRLVRRRRVTAPVAGTSQVTPAMVNCMPASRVTGAPAPRAEGPATTRRPSPGGVIECRRTDGVRIQSAAAPLARGATQTATSSAASATKVVARARARRGCRAVWGRVAWTPVSRSRRLLLQERRRVVDPSPAGSRPCLHGVGPPPRFLEQEVGLGRRLTPARFAAAVQSARGAC